MCIRDRYKVAYDLKLSIPEQLSIVGFDNSLMADVIAPHLTTCEMPTERLAQLAVEYIDTYIRTGEMIHMPVLEGKMLLDVYKRQRIVGVVGSNPIRSMI